MAQKTFVDGDVLTASDLNTYCSGEGGAWTSYTPQVDQGASTNIAKTVTYGKYARYGRMITFTFYLAITASGTGGSKVTVTLPVTAAGTQGVIGAGIILDGSVGSADTGSWRGASTTTVQFESSVASVAPQGWGANPSIALANGDTLIGSITYEAAS